MLRNDRESLEARLKDLFGLKSRFRRRRPGRAPKWAYPWKVQRAYEELLLDVLGPIERAVREQLIPMSRNVLRELESETSSTFDSAGDDLEKGLNAFEGRTEMGDVPQKDLEDVFSGANQKNLAEWRAIAAHSIGVELHVQEPWIDSLKKSFIAENTKLIKSLHDEAVREAAGIVTRGVVATKRHEVIRKQLQESLVKNRNRAALIARDQIAKVNGALMKHRQTAIGVRAYVWRTVSDERVRSKHANMDGLTCNWSDPGVYWSGQEWVSRSAVNGPELHPGQDYQCRCWAEPVFRDGDIE